MICDNIKNSNFCNISSYSSIYRPHNAILYPILLHPRLSTRSLVSWNRGRLGLSCNSGVSMFDTFLSSLFAYHAASSCPFQRPILWPFLPKTVVLKIFLTVSRAASDTLTEQPEMYRVYRQNSKKHTFFPKMDTVLSIRSSVRREKTR
jgi:hypothetical protein